MSDLSPYKLKKRLSSILVLIAFLFTAIFAQLIRLQTIEAEEMQILALEQWLRDVPMVGQRGDIFDRNGQLLATSETVYTLYVRPKEVENADSTASFIAQLFGMEKETVRKKITSRASEVTIRKNVIKGEMTALLSSGFTGFYFSQNSTRKYVYGDFLSSVLGFTNVDGVGQTGLENSLNGYLQGGTGYVLTETDLVGRKIADGTTYYVAGKKGCDVYLTVDYALQYIVQSAVNDAYTEHGAKATSCIVLNAKTGAIEAIAQSPSFDLNNLPRQEVATLLSLSKNTIISNVYEPGSTFKMLTASLGLEEGKVSLSSAVYCPGYRIVDGTKIKCWKTTGHGSQNFEKGVQNSCNCLFMDIALSLGTDKMYEGLEKFGIKEKTGVDLPGEGKGIMIQQDEVKNVDLARMGFGQAVAVTALELITACTAVVNGGELLQPYIVEAVKEGDKVIYQGQKTVCTQVISADTSRIMRSVLESVVAEGGGKNAKVEGYRIGGKTGTAQKYSEGKIAQGKYVATFVGFAPADDPEYILLFIVDEPSQGAYYGSIVAAPYAGRIFSELFTYKGWMSSVHEETAYTVMPDLLDKSREEADKLLKNAGLSYEEYGEGHTVVYQFPASGAEIKRNTVCYFTLE